MTNSIVFHVGDATAPIGVGSKIIVHCCNDIGAWGAGFVLAISRRWKEPEQQFRTLINPQLGDVEFVAVKSHDAAPLWVANLIGQHGVRNTINGPPIRYDAIKAGLQKVCEFAKVQNASVHMPRMGAGLAGGDWEIIQKITEEELINKGISVTVYDLPAIKKKFYSWGK